MKGEATDGHRFVDQAFAQGAAGSIVSEATDHPHVLVADGFVALQALGRASRARTAAKIVGVTGSVGKTSAKEALFAALDRSMPGRIHRSVKSYNNHTGVPLSLARMPRDADIGVFEMGMNHAGELAELTRMVRPDVAIVTAIAPAHTEFFPDESAIADAKGEIFQGLQPGGTAIVPFDSPHRDRLIAAARPHAARIVTFGLTDGADVRAIEAMRLPTGTFMTARVGDEELSVTIAQPGMHWVSNALAVLAAVQAVGADLGLAGLALADLGGACGAGRADDGAGRRRRGDRHRRKLQRQPRLDGGDARGAGTRTRPPCRGTGRDARAGATGRPRITPRSPTRSWRQTSKWRCWSAKRWRRWPKRLRGRVEFVHVADAQAALASLRRVVAAGDTVLVKGSNGVGLARLVAGLGGVT